MKKLLFFIAILFSIITSSHAKSLEDSNIRIPLIGEVAPSFTAESTNGVLNFPNDYGRKWKILFSHPQDFTSVCSTEILELAIMQEEFDKLGVKLVVVSVDPVESHIQWKKALEDLNYKDRVNVKIKFPIVSDENLAISKKYGMIHPESNNAKSVRGVFMIDPDNIIQALYFYPMNVGRSTEEIVRLVQALQTTANENVMTPANWMLGDDLLVPALSNTQLNDPKFDSKNFYSNIWFMWFKKAH